MPVLERVHLGSSRPLERSVLLRPALALASRYDLPAPLPPPPGAYLLVMQSCMVSSPTGGVEVREGEESV